MNIDEAKKIIELLNKYEQDGNEQHLLDSFNIWRPYTMLKGSDKESEFDYSNAKVLIENHHKFFICAISVYFCSSWYIPEENEILSYCNIQQLDQIFNTIMFKLNIA